MSDKEKSVPSAESPYTHPLGEIIAGKYGVVEHLGRGGFGEVYLVEILSGMVGEKLALKLLHASVSEDEERRERFLNEIRLAMKLVDKHIVTVRDVGTNQNGHLYFTMDYCPGRTLSELLKREGALEIQRGVTLVMRVLSGLKTAHEQGIIHRDLKPANLIVESGTSGETVRILDFGIATAFEPGAGRSTKMIGTPRYMAPEQFIGEPVTFSSDLYSVGILLYECLAGQHPYKGSTPREILRALTKSAITPLAEVREELAGYPEVGEVVVTAMQRNPEKRFQSSGEFLDALKRAVSRPAEQPAKYGVAKSRERATRKRGMSVGQRVAFVLGIAAIVVVGIFLSDQMISPGDRASDGSLSTPGVVEIDSEDADELKQQGFNAFEGQQYQVAIQYLEKALVHGDKSPELHLYLGESYYLTGPGPENDDESMVVERAIAHLTTAGTPRANRVSELIRHASNGTWDMVSRTLQSAGREGYNEDRVVRALVKKLDDRDQAIEDAPAVTTKPTPPVPKAPEPEKVEPVVAEPEPEPEPEEPEVEFDYAGVKTEADTLFQEKRYGEAAKLFVALLEQEPEAQTARRLAQCYLEEGNENSAHEVLVAALKGEILDITFEYEMLRLAVDTQLEEQRTTHVTAHLDRAWDLIDKLEIHRGDRQKYRAEIYALRARYEVFENGEFSRAKRMLDLSNKKKYPKSPELYFHYGESFYFLVKNSASSAVDRDDAAQECIYHLGNFAKGGRGRTKPECYEMMGRAYAYRQEWSKARKAYGKGLRAYKGAKIPEGPKNRRMALLHSLRGDSYLREAERKRRGGADVKLKEALKSYKASFDLYQRLGTCGNIVDCYQRLGLTDTGCQWLKENFLKKRQQWRKKTGSKNEKIFKRIDKFFRKCR